MLVNTKTKQVKVLAYHVELCFPTAFLREGPALQQNVLVHKGHTIALSLVVLVVEKVFSVLVVKLSQPKKVVFLRCLQMQPLAALKSLNAMWRVGAQKAHWDFAKRIEQVAHVLVMTAQIARKGSSY